MLNTLYNRLQKLINCCSGHARRRKKAFHTSADSLETRQVLTASMVGAVAPNCQWQVDLNGGATADRQFGLGGDQFVVGNWSQTGDQPGVARKDGLYLRWYLNTDADVSPTHESSFL